MNDRELLEDQVMCAVRTAIDAAKAAMQLKISEVSGGLNLPGLF